MCYALFLYAAFPLGRLRVTFSFRMVLIHMFGVLGVFKTSVLALFKSPMTPC